VLTFGPDNTVLEEPARDSPPRFARHLRFGPRRHCSRRRGPLPVLV